MSSSWQGKINLVYNSQNHHTILCHNYSQAPLKVQRPFYPEGNEVCHTALLHTGGGIVGGDSLSYNIELQPHARALITTTSAAKIYRSPGHFAQQTIEIHLADDTHLEWLPLETIIFNGALFSQNTKIYLSEKSTLLLWEINRFGRTARGEEFTTGLWHSHTEIWQNNTPLWIDWQSLPGQKETIHSYHTLAGFPLIATLVFFGQPISVELVDNIRQLLPTPDNTWEAGVSRLNHGLICRYRGHSTPQIKHWFLQVWDLLRHTYQQRSACLPRFWPV